MRLPILLLSLFIICAPAARAVDGAMDKALLREIVDAAIILSADQGKARKWERAPAPLIVGGTTRDRRAALEIMRDIETQSGLVFERAEGDKVDAAEARFFTDGRARLAYDGGALSASALQNNTPIGGPYNYLILILTPDEAPYYFRELQLVTGLARSFVQSNTPCFFQTRGRRDRIENAVIVIDARLDAEKTRFCLGEEMTQAMGLVNDSTGSRVFSLDDEYCGTRRCMWTRGLGDSDRMLLRALYHPEIAPGDHAAKVIERYLELRAGVAESGDALN